MTIAPLFKEAITYAINACQTKPKPELLKASPTHLFVLSLSSPEENGSILITGLEPIPDKTVNTYFIERCYTSSLEKEYVEKMGKLSGNTYFVNGIPTLCEALEKAGRGKEAQDLVKQFLISSFNEDLDKKVERFRKLPSGIFPAEMGYFRVFWELNQIYIAGLYYITVIAAGVLCERMCYDLLAKKRVKAKDGLGLFELIKLLTENKLAKAETLVEMEAIRKKRNEYVHPKKKITNTEKDASEMIERISKVLHNEFAVP